MRTISKPKARMQLPLIIRQNSESFIIRDHANTMICTIHYENDPSRQNTTKRMNEETAREMAKRIARLLTEN